MANIKKPRALRKKSRTYSLTTRVIEDFEEACEIEGINPSHKLDEIMKEETVKMVGV